MSTTKLKNLFLCIELYSTSWSDLTKCYFLLLDEILRLKQLSIFIMDAQWWSQVGKDDETYVYTTVYVPDLAFKNEWQF